MLSENGLTEFYEMGQAAGVRGGAKAGQEQFRFVDRTGVRERLVDYSDERCTRVRFHLPAIHCIACVWLLENLFRLNPGIGQSQVNFPQKEIAISFDPNRVQLSEVVALLSSLGYEPELKLSDLEIRPRVGRTRRIWLQLGIAGFAFGNTMLFSIASYLGLDSFSRAGFERLVGGISLVLALPVVLYSASDYWRSAWLSLRQRLLNIDVPIAAGILALFGQSTYEVLSGRGAGYFDSMAGLLFFLLCGKLFQQKTFDRLAFERDYRSFFPISVTRRNGSKEETVALSQLAVGDKLLIRNAELIPADARLLEGEARIDYSFVTGESDPVQKRAGDYLYAGGRQMGGGILVEMLKSVSQGYLTSLWNQDAFAKKDKSQTLQDLTNRYSQRFTKLVIATATGSALFWAASNPAVSVKAFVSVLIVACPCALALAAPFALGTAQRVLARRKVFLKNPSVVESLAAVDAIVFDKTGTLTALLGKVDFYGAPLAEGEARQLCALAQDSTHPLAMRVRESLGALSCAEPTWSFVETPGCGMEGWVGANRIAMGSAEWLRSKGVALEETTPEPRQPISGSAVHLAIDGRYRGWFELGHSLRPATDRLIAALGKEYQLALLSGDNEKESARFRRLFGESAPLHFKQSPMDKLGFVRRLQQSGRTVLMVGDGLNDAGALRQSDVGVAVVEDISAFSPASDVILAADMVPQLNQIVRFARRAAGVVRASFLISGVYNLIGISIAARGGLSPVICAVLMPLSSFTVVAFACGVTSWMGKRMVGRQASAADQTEAVR